MIKIILRKLLGQYYNSLVKIYWLITSYTYPIFFRQKPVLIYAGINVGDSFQKIFYKYKRVIGFEPNPLNFEKLRRFNFRKGVEIYNYALSKKDGEADLHLPMDINNEASASLSDFSKGYQFSTKKIIKVKTVNPSKFLKKRKINHIDFYISDIEGYDFTILKLMKKDYLDFNLIKKIQVEAVNNKVNNPYKSVSNYESDFDSLLLDKYTKKGRGSGFVNEGDDFSGNTLDILYELKP